MPNQTQNYNLVKPLTTENYDVNIFNGNADIIDSTLKNIAEQLNDCAKDIDDSRTTTSKTVTGAINELDTKKVNQSSLDNIASYYAMGLRGTSLSIATTTESIINFDALAGTKTDLFTDGNKTITLPKGTYMINAKVTITSNSIGYRTLKLCTTDETLDPKWQLANDTKNAVNGTDTTLEINRIIVIDNTEKFALYIYQNSGVALNLNAGDNNTSVSIRRIL